MSCIDKKMTHIIFVATLLVLLTGCFSSPGYLFGGNKESVVADEQDQQNTDSENVDTSTQSSEQNSSSSQNNEPPQKELAQQESLNSEELEEKQVSNNVQILSQLDCEDPDENIIDRNIQSIHSVLSMEMQYLLVELACQNKQGNLLHHDIFIEPFSTIASGAYISHLTQQFFHMTLQNEARSLGFRVVDKPITNGNNLIFRGTLAQSRQDYILNIQVLATNRDRLMANAIRYIPMEAYMKNRKSRKARGMVLGE